MRTFNKQAASLKNNLKQNNLMPLFVVFLVIVFLSLTYKSVSKVSGVGNTMFKEGNRNRRRRVRQGFREGQNDDEETGLFANEDDDDDDGDDGDDGVTGFRNRRRRVRQGFREGQYEEERLTMPRDVGKTMFKEGNRNRGRRVRQGFREGKETNKNPTVNTTKKETTKKESVEGMSEGFLSSAKYQGFTSSRARGRK